MKGSAQNKYKSNKQDNSNSNNTTNTKMSKKRVIESSDDESDTLSDAGYETISDTDEIDNTESEDDDGSDEEDGDEDEDETCSSNSDHSSTEESNNETEKEKKKTDKKYKIRSSSNSNNKKSSSSSSKAKQKEKDKQKEKEKEIQNEVKNAFVSIIKEKLKKKVEEMIQEEEGNKKSSKKRVRKDKKNNKKQDKDSDNNDDDDNSYSDDEDDRDDDEYEDDYDEEEYDEDYDEEDDECEHTMSTPGFILLDGGGGGFDIRSDEHDYRKMIKEDKHEKCTSDDEQTFMKESYKPVARIETPETSPKNKPKLSPTSNKTKKAGTSSSSSSTKHHNKKQKKGDEAMGDDNKLEEKEEKEETVESKYAELVKLREDLTEQLKKAPKNKILRNAIQECRKSISDLVKKERNKNTDKYYKLVHQDPKKNKNTNEMSYFKKKLSHKEQLRVMKDLKVINSLTNTDKPYRLSLLESDIPPKFKAIALQKLNVLKSMEPSDSEYYKMKNWVDGFMRVPYGIYKNLSVNLKDGVDKCHAFIQDAKETLDNCTYGLNDAKLQILQMVGQWITNPGAMGTAIAIKGPPGTGKTTLVKEGISKILGREFAFIALGGTSDASFLEGHSYTYEGSTWGKIVSILMECKCMNPVIYFDELDKISDTPKGEEIASILTHLTDTSQNSQFHDKYFCEVDFDLSKCLFIFSYNDESKVNPILKDRMYRIQTKGYEAKEKIIIARHHLLPKIREQVNFSEEDIIIPDSTLDYIINHPAFCKQEQGVRNLKRCLEIIHTKLNLFRLVKPDQNLFSKDIAIDVSFPFTVDKKHVDIMIKSDDTLNQSMLAMYT
jgi:ATP-dependent Lon protease